MTATFPGAPPSAEVELVRFPTSRRTPFETFFTNAAMGGLSLAWQARRWRPDVVVLSSYDVAFGYRWLAGPTPIAYIYHSRFHSDAVDRVGAKPWPLSLAAGPLRAFVRFVERTTFSSACRIIAVSSFSRDEIVERAPGTAARIRILPTGVDTDFFSPGDRVAARQRLGIADDALVLVTVGRLSPVKRYDRAIEALALLRGRLDRPPTLLIVGEGPEAERLRSLADRAAPGLVRFEGYREGQELRQRLWAADLQLCTSEFENWSIALLEGLSCGLPVLGTPRGGTPELLRQVDPRLVLPSIEPVDLADAIARLASDEPARRALAARARTVAERYGWDRVVDGLERELRQTAASA